MGDWNSSGAEAAYFVVATNGTVNQCRTSGYTLVAALQGRLRQLLATPGNAWNGPVRASDIAIDANWGPNTMRGLYAVLARAGGNASALQAIQRDAGLERGQHISQATLLAAVQLLVAAPGVDHVELAVGTVTPRYRTALPEPTTEDARTISCSVVRGPTASTGGDAPPPPAPPPADTSRGDAGSTGGKTPSEVGPPVPTGVYVPPPRPGSSVSWGLVATVGIGLAGVAVISYLLVKQQSKASGGFGATRTAENRRPARRHR